MQYKSLWIKASAKCINVNLNVPKYLINEHGVRDMHKFVKHRCCTSAVSTLAFRVASWGVYQI